MRKFLLLTFPTLFFLVPNKGISQSCVPTNLNGTTITVSCGNPCTSLNFQVPHLKSTETYAFSSIPYNPFQWVVSSGGTEDPSLYADDEYSQVFNLPFPFCFYDSTYTKAVVGSNGLITFDETNASCANAFNITPPIPSTGGGAQCSQFATYYPRAAIMAAYTDLDPRSSESAADRLIQWRVEGTAPCRKFIVTYYRIGVYGARNCTLGTATTPPSPTTFQMVMYESTGIIDIYIENKTCQSSTTGGRTILGIQNYNRDAAVFHPARNATVWTAVNEGWRFTPNGNTSQFVSAQLLDMTGAVIAAADTATTVQGMLDISFPNICPGPTVTQYVVKTTFNSCPTGTLMVSLDTINVQRNNTLPVTSSVTATTCGNNTGTITVNVIGTPGVPPYQFSINGGTLQSSNVFTGLAAGTYTVFASDAAGCDTSFQVTITASSSLTHTSSFTNAGCPGVNNGTITVTPTSGQAPFTYTINGNPNPSGTFTNLAPGSYSIIYTDAIGCTGTLTQVIGPGTAISATSSSTTTSCAGASDGTITVTPTSGAAPYTYSLNGGTPQSGNVFSNLPAGTYSITIVDANGCSVTISRTVTAGSGLSGAIYQTPASCPGVNDGTVTLNPTTGTAPFTYQLDGGAPQSSNVFTGVSSGNHTVTFTDANGCQGSRTITVGGGTAPNTTATAANTSCAGASNGIIVINPVAGSTYTINPGNISNTTGTFTGLAAGTYTLSITTSGGCAGTVTPASVTIADGAPVTTTATSSAASCTGVNDGSITVTPVGTGITTYTINPGAISNTTGVFSGLAAGTYTVSFVTSAGCTGTVTSVVSANSAPTTTATSSAATCPGAADGTVTVTPVGTGTTYTLNPGAISNSTGVFTGLAAGTYTITFVTAAGCTGTVPTNPVVTSGTAPTSTAPANATTCPGVNDGTITVAPVGTGTTYTLNPGAISNSTGVFTGLAAGTYTITFVTAAGCTGTVPTNPVVTSGTAPTSTATANATTCPGVNDGTITVAPVGTGTTYTLNPGAISNSTGVFTGLAAGTYTITFVTAAGCTGTVPTNPVVTSGTAPTSTATANATTCPGVNDGTITVAPVGTGTTYTLNPGAISNSTGVFTGLAAGTYTITFVTAAGCNGTVPTNPVVTSGTAPTSTATTINTSCPTVNDGVVTTTPVGAGTTYTLNPGSVSNTTGVFTGLAAGTYTVTFTTAAGCNGTVPVNPVVAAGPFLASTFTQVNPVCAGINDGSISISPSAPAAGPFTVTLTGPGGPYTATGLSPVVFNNLAPGTYNYSFTDAGGCTGTGGPVTLTSNPPINTPAVLLNPSCNGSANGTVTFNTAGGVTPYQYSINAGGTYQASSIFSGLAAGTHTFRIRDNVGCIKDTTIILTQPTALVNVVSASSPAGCSNNDGSITATASGATGPYTYTIAGPTVNTSGASTGVFTGLANGSYTITATDAQGCTTPATGTVNLIDNMYLSLGNDTTICELGTITFNPQTNPETNIFTWTGINGTATSTIANPSIKNAVATPRDTATYELFAQWGGCSRRDTIVVNLLYQPIANAGSDTAICINTTAVLSGSSSHASGGVIYEWSPAAGIADPTQPVTTVDPSASSTSIPSPNGSNTFTYTLTVRDQYGCNFAVTDEVKVTVQPPVPAFAGHDTTAVSGTAHQLMATGGVSYLWSPSAPLNSANIQNPLATLTDDQKFVVQVTDIAGCIGYDTVFVKVYAGPNYYIPNAFTPNGDGLNDIFRPIPVGMVKTEWFRVFNRYGEVVFETTQWMKGWDGSFRGKQQPVGAYVWAIKGVDRNGKKIEMKGTVMLVQ